MRILIADDDPKNRYLLESVLTSRGHVCVAASNGTDALGALRSDRGIEAIVSDILMPGMDGFQLCRETRRDPTLSQLPFVFYTATYTDADDKAFGLALGANAYLLKPAEPDVILEVLEGILRQPMSAAVMPSDDDGQFYERYNPRLVAKLEEKVLELEDARAQLQVSNRSLRGEIARRADAESALRQTLALVEATVLSTADGVLAYDNDGSVVASNPQFFRAFGLDRTQPSSKAEMGVELRGQLAEPEELDALWADEHVDTPLELAVATGGCVELRRRPLRLGTETIGVVFSCTDVTARRHAQARELELQRELLEGQKLADLGSLAAGIAHDFNNVLSVIVVGLGALRSEVPKAGDVDEAIDDILHSANAGASLVAQILQFSRRDKVAPEKVNISRAVRDTTRLLKLMTPPSVELHLELEDTRSSVFAHPSQLTQLVLNLGANGIQAIDGSGRLSISVRQAPETAQRRTVELAVADTGSGLTAEAKHSLFQRHFTTKPEGEGTGLGLSTVRQIVRSLGGTIDVRSRPGGGTTFCIRLPVADELVEVAGPAAAPLAPAREFIVLEPDPSDAENLSKLLREAGHSCVTVRHARDAIAMFRAHPAQYGGVLIGDPEAPASGAELVRVFRALRSDIPIVLTTAPGFSHLVEQPGLGPYEVLSKPYTTPALVTAIGRAVQRVG